MPEYEKAGNSMSEIAGGSNTIGRSLSLIGRTPELQIQFVWSYCGAEHQSPVMQREDYLLDTH